MKNKKDAYLISKFLVGQNEWIAFDIIDFLFFFFSIEKIKEQRTQELYNERANAPDPDCPIGHVRMDEEKRLSTLRQLELSNK